MIGGWGGFLGGAAQGATSEYSQYQKIAAEMLRRQQIQQQMQQTQRQAPLQDAYLRAQIAHMQRPDVGQQQFAQNNAVALQGLQLPMPGSAPLGATPMPQPPQGGMPPAFQSAQPMPGVSPGMPPQAPQGQPGTQPNPFAQAPQGQPGMPQGPAGTMMQPPSPMAMQPQGAAPGPQAMPTADPVAQQEQQFMQGLQQQVQVVRAMPPGPQQTAAAIAIQQRQEAGQQFFQRARMAAQQQLKEHQLEEYRKATLVQRGQAQEGQAQRSQTTSITSQRDTDRRGLDQALASGMISQEVHDAGVAKIDEKYGSIAPGAKGQGRTPTTPELRDKLEAAVEAKFGTASIPESAIGTIVSVEGKQYKVINDNGAPGFEPVK